MTAFTTQNGLTVTCDAADCLCNTGPVMSTPVTPQPTEDERFDQLTEAVQDWCQKVTAARDCPKSEQGWRDKEAAEAEAAIRAEFLRGVR